MDNALKVVPFPQRQRAARSLTQRVVDLAKPQADRYEIRDPSLPGFLLRVTPNGKKTYYVSTRVGHGRDTKRVRVQVGDARVLELSKARDKARRIISDAKDGIDPTARPDEEPISEHLDDYETELGRRDVVKASDMMTTLRRGLDGRLMPSQVTRMLIVAEIERLEQAKRPGAAEYFRKTVATFLNWLVERGAVTASPMAGYRRPRATKAQRLAKRPWVMTTAEEIKRFWQATAKAANPIHRDLLRFMLLTGQRRTETSLIEWGHRSKDRWDIPPEVTKTGMAHSVPLGTLSLELLEGQVRHNDTQLIFPGRGLGPISGWSKLIEPVRTAYGDPRLSCHGLRRTFRTGLSSLGVEEPVAELMIAHKRSDLVGRYDHSDLWEKRVAAQQGWEEYVGRCIK